MFPVRCLLLVVALIACTTDPSSPSPSTRPTAATAQTGTDTGSPDPTEPPFGTLSVTAEDRTWELELVAPVSLSEEPLDTMEWRAEHAGRAVRLTAFLVDDNPIAETDYPVGQWGGELQQFGVTVRVTSGGIVSVYQTPVGRTAEGTLSVDRLDRATALASTTWSAELDKMDEKGTVVGTARVESTMTDAPLVLY